MKTLLLLLALTTITACGKKSAMDKRNNPTNPTGSPVDVATNEPPTTERLILSLKTNKIAYNSLIAIDPDSTDIKFKIVNQPQSGTVLLDESTGFFSYIPNHDFIGVDSFSFKAEDEDSVSNTSTVSLNVQELEYKLTETMSATANYATDTATQTKYRSGGLESSLSVRNESFKIPQELIVTQGWASHSTTAKLTLTKTGVTIVCTYTSQATGTQTSAVPTMDAEYASKGLKYVFSNCSNNAINPSVLVDDIDNIVLKVNSASNLETTTRVEAEIEIYE